MGPRPEEPAPNPHRDPEHGGRLPPKHLDLAHAAGARQPRPAPMLVREVERFAGLYAEAQPRVVGNVERVLLNGEPPSVLTADQLLSAAVLLTTGGFRDLRALLLTKCGREQIRGALCTKAAHVEVLIDGSPESVRALIKAIGPEAPRSDGATLLHEAAAAGTPAFVGLLVSEGARIDAPDAQGETPLHYAVRSSQVGSVRALAERGADPARRGAEGAGPFDLAVREGSIDLILALLPRMPDEDLLPGGAPSDELAQRLLDRDRKAADELFKALKERIARVQPRESVREGAGWMLADSVRTLESLSQDDGGLFREFFALLRAKGSFEHAALYAESAHDALLGVSGDAFPRLLPQLVFAYPADAAVRLAGHIDMAVDGADGAERGHPNEAELMALLAHPRDPEFHEKRIAPFTYALTAIDQWESRAQTATGLDMWNWARIGVLTFSFGFWKYDARRVLSSEEESGRRSLLECAGFRFAGERRTDELFGAGFTYRAPREFQFDRIDESGRAIHERFKTSTLAEWRRGYLLCADPEFGALVIRNSSPLFGRSALSRPAYYADPSHRLTPGALSRLTDEQIESDFRSTLDPDVASTYRGPLSALIDRLLALKDRYRAWKCDTDRDTAWEAIPRLNYLQPVGAHQSRGFPRVVELLERLSELATFDHGNTAVPDLAFVHPRYPPWAPYARLQVTPAVLSGLRALTALELTPEQEHALGLREFFRTGYREQAELVLVSGESMRNT